MFVEPKESRSATYLEVDKEIVKKEVEVLKPEPMKEVLKKKRVSYFKLQFTFANRQDIILIIFACMGSLIAGCSMPMVSLLLGKGINNFSPSMDKTDLNTRIKDMVINFMLAGAGIFIGSIMMVFFWSIVGKRLTNKVSEEYFRVLMRQEQGWFDQTNAFEFATKVQTQVKTIENGIGQKVGLALLAISQFVSSFLIGYITSWQLSLVLMSMLPLLGLGGWCMSKAMQQGSQNNTNYEKAGGMAEEVLYNIKTVASFCNFEYELNKYQGYLKDSLKAGLKAGFKTGMGIGFIIFIIYCSYALAVGYGSLLVATEKENKNTGYKFEAGDVITVLFSIIFGCFSIGQATPYIKAIYEACYAATELFELRMRKPLIDLTYSTEKPPKDMIQGRMTFDNVNFAYPSKPDHLILRNIDLLFEAGKKTAIVGESGSGKSTVLSLIERFYDPQEGNIKIDDHNIKNIDIKYWRSLIGYVPQEPVLFNTSITENIIFGRENITTKEIDAACEKAYAMEFIKNIGFDYMVGIKGSKLSGGQKQRIAIARAILTQPKLLILDEATSALDNKSEKEVQKALDIVSQGVTTIIIAHRLQTIMNSDKIICLDQGHVVEVGTHDQLMAKNGFYANLVQSHAEKEKKEKEKKLQQNAILEENEDESECSEEDVDNIPSERNLKEALSEVLRNRNNEVIGVDSIILEDPVLSENVKKKNNERKKTHPMYINNGNINSIENLNINKNDKNYFTQNDNSVEDVKIDTKNFNSNGSNFRANSNSNNVSPSNRKKSDARKPSMEGRKSSKIKTDPVVELKQEPLKPIKEEPINTKELRSAQKKVLKLLQNDKSFLFGAGISAACNGAVWPIYGILLADAIGVLLEKDLETVRTGGFYVAMMFLGLAVAAALVLWMQK